MRVRVKIAIWQLAPWWCSGHGSWVVLINLTTRVKFLLFKLSFSLFLVKREKKGIPAINALGNHGRESSGTQACDLTKVSFYCIFVMPYIIHFGPLLLNWAVM